MNLEIALTVFYAVNLCLSYELSIPFLDYLPNEYWCSQKAWTIIFIADRWVHIKKTEINNKCLLLMKDWIIRTSKE